MSSGKFHRIEPNEEETIVPGPKRLSEGKRSISLNNINYKGEQETNVKKSHRDRTKHSSISVPSYTSRHQNQRIPTIDFRPVANSNKPSQTILASLGDPAQAWQYTTSRSRYGLDCSVAASRDSASEETSSLSSLSPRMTDTPSGSGLRTPRRRLDRTLTFDKLVESSMDKGDVTEEFLAQLKLNHILTYITRDDKKMIYGGTLEKIVLQLLDWLLTEANRKDIFRLVRIFISCYRKYYNPMDLFEIIIALWSADPPEGKDSENGLLARTRSGLMLFLSEWIDVQYSDFDGIVFERLEAFVLEMPVNYRKPLISKIQNAVKPKKREMFCLFEPTKLIPGRVELSDLKAEVIADQWTILDFRNFRKIPRSDFVNEKVSEHWEMMVKRSSMFTLWVASEIVQNLNITKRVEVIKKFIQVGMRFLENGNFNGLMCVWGGLNSVYVHRLTKTRKKLSKQSIQIWQSLEIKLAEEGNFRQLRNAMEKLQKKKEPMVPWFELLKKMRERVEEYDDFLLEEPKMAKLGGSDGSPTTPQKGPHEGTMRSSSGNKSSSSTPRRSDSDCVKRDGEKPTRTLKTTKSSKTRKKKTRDNPNKDDRKSVGSDSPVPLKPHNPILNFGKMRLIGDQILDFDQMQENNAFINLYTAESTSDTIIRNYLEHLPVYDDQVLWKFSHQCEPSESTE